MAKRTAKPARKSARKTARKTTRAGTGTRRAATARKATRRNAPPKLTRILSIDGGGIRGVIPGQILVQFESILQQKTNDPSARIADFFDLLAGTSTGGILTCLYLVPAGVRGKSAKRPKFSAAQAVSLYLDRGKDVFTAPVMHRIRTAGGMTDEKYPANGLEKALRDYLGDLELKRLLKPCLITAYDIQRRRTMFFNQSDARRRPGYNFRVRDVARATSAAPTYFETARIKSKSGISYALIDGGVFANNPALCAYAEARHLAHAPTAAQMAVLSLGTGVVKKPYPYKTAKDWGPIGWIKPVLDIMMTGVAETVDYELAKIFDSVHRRSQYLRIEPDLGAATPDLDDATPANLLALREAGQYAAEQHRAQLEAFADLIIAAS